jgi:hypothetical protein
VVDILDATHLDLRRQAQRGDPSLVVEALRLVLKAPGRPEELGRYAGGDRLGRP